MKKIMIIGATSAIAEATARIFAARNYEFFLIGRSRNRLEAVSKDLMVRGAVSVYSEILDVNDFEEHPAKIECAFYRLKEIDIVLIAHGSLPDQAACESNVGLALKEVNTNAISTISMLTLISNRMEKAGRGTIAVITSVAGERGRKSNYVYGCSKGMVSIFLQGLRNRLCRSNVHVIDIRPGFVDTPMTEKFDKGFLWATTDQIADCIVNGIDKQKNMIYAPFFWRFIMFIIRNIPENIFKSLNI